MLAFVIVITEPICASIDLGALDLPSLRIDSIKYGIYEKDSLVEQRTCYWDSSCLPTTR